MKKKELSVDMQTVAVNISAEEVLEKVIDDYTTSKQQQMMQLRRGVQTKADFIADAKEHIKKYYRTPDEMTSEVIKLFEQYVFAYSRLTPLIEDPDISDIRCVAFDDIRVKKKGKRCASGITFRSEKEYRNFIEFVATKNQVNISNLNAIQRFTDNTSMENYILRFTVIMPILNTYESPYLCIRKVPIEFPELDDLAEEGMLPPRLATELTKRFQGGSTLICGGNSSGKTTLLNALKETLPEDVAVLVCQQADELTTKNHPDMMFIHSLPGSGESRVSYDLKDISIAGLTMDVDFFIVGETKGDEAAYILNAAYSGQICATTIHALSADKAMDKLTDYALAAPQNHYSKSELQKMLASCFQTVIHMRGYKVNEVCAVEGFDAERGEVTYRTIYRHGKWTDEKGVSD